MPNEVPMIIQYRDLQRRTPSGGKNITQMMEIPPAYESYVTKELEMDANAFEHYKSIVLGNKNLLLAGGTGCGKTHLAVRLMKEWVLVNWRHGLNDTGYLCPTDKYAMPKFKTFADIVMECQECFKTDKLTSDIIHKYSMIDLVVFDEFPMKLNDYTVNIIDQLMEKRTQNLKPSIITSNISPEGMGEMGFSRVISRICGNGEIVTLTGRDRRIQPTI